MAGKISKERKKEAMQTDSSIVWNAALALVAVAVLGAHAAEIDSSGGKPVTLRRGEVCVVTPQKPPAYVRFAATEMTNLLAKVLGATVPWVHEPPKTGTSIILGTNEWSRAAGLHPEGLPRDGYIIRTDTDRLYIAGIDDPAGWVGGKSIMPWDMNSEHATIFGVYGFLEKFAGVRFYFPGELGTIIPQTDALSIPATDMRSMPDFQARRYSFSNRDFGTIPGIPDDDEAARTYASVKHRLRMRAESLWIPCCHGQYTANFAARFAKTHPEYFLLRKDGTRHTRDTRRQPQSANAHLCQSSKVWDELYEDAAAYFTGKDSKTRGFPSGWRWQARSGKYYDVMPNDGMPECQCADCQKQFAAAPDQQYRYTPLVWSKTVELANRLKANGIKGTITQMAYSSYRGLPDFDIPDNVAVMVAENGPWAENDKTQSDADDAEIAAWAKKTGGRVWIWTYVGKFACAGTDIPNIPCTTPHAVGRYYKRVAPNIFGAYEELRAERFAYQYLNVYIFSRICWDNSIDPEALIAEHHRLMFGAGAPDMARFFDTIERKWIYEVRGRSFTTPMGPKTMTARDYEVWSRIYTEKAIAELDGMIDAALAAVPEGSMEARRIALMRAEFIVPLREAARKGLEKIDPVRAAQHRARTPDRSIFKGGSFDSLEGWTIDCGNVSIDRTCFRSAPGALKLVATDTRSEEKDGAPFLRAAATIPLPALKPGTNYRISWFEKLENVAPTDTFGGFSMCMCDTVDRSWPWPNFHVGTSDWFYQTYDLTTRAGSNAEGQSYLRPRITTGTGTVWIDDIRLEEIK